MTGPPLITVITVTLDAGAALRETAESVLAQEGASWEYLVKDGGSADGSVEALPRDDRLRVETGEDAGIYDAMNRAVPLAKGDYVNFLNAGDRFPSRETLAKVSEAIRSAPEPPDLLYGDFLDERSAKVRRSAPGLSRRHLFLSGICHQAQWIRRDLFEELGGFDLRYPMRADQELLLRLAERGASALHLPEVLALYDGRGFTAQRENRAELDREWRELRETRYTPGERLRWGLRSALGLLWLKRLALDTMRCCCPGVLERRARRIAEREDSPPADPGSPVT